MRYLFLLNPTAGKRDCTAELAPAIQAAAQRAQPWEFGKESVHAYRPPQGGDCPSCDVVLGRHFSIQKPPISILKSAAKAPAGSLLLPGATGKSLAAAHTIRSEKAAVIQVF